MKQFQIIIAALIVAASILTAAVWLRQAPDAPDGAGMVSHSHDEGEEEAETGPHGGRLLRDGAVAVEVSIVENGHPPEMRLFAYRDEVPLDPGEFSASVELDRLGGRRDTLAFMPENDYLRSDGSVREPHSFDVRLTASIAGREHRWSYESHEGRTQISSRAAEASGIRVERTGPATIVESVELTGTVQTDPGRVSMVRPRFAGIVTEVRNTIGDRVSAGDRLATIETNESLRSVPVAAPIDGLVIDRDIQTGQVAGEDPLFVIADLSEIWIQLDVFGSQMASIRIGQDVEIRTLDGFDLTGTVDWIAPLVAHGSQSTRARIRVPNPEYRLRPGQFVQASVIADRFDVPLAVRRTALQTFREFDVVFAQVGDTYEVRMLELGRMDDSYAEVLAGLEAGEIYVTDNSYLIKADIEKAGASHDH
jgi:cobalt-zinc-cadmium efflux system membrane fusion protein